jgi:hypothetical protein
MDLVESVLEKLLDCFDIFVPDRFGVAMVFSRSALVGEEWVGT